MNKFKLSAPRLLPVILFAAECFPVPVRRPRAGPVRQCPRAEDQPAASGGNAAIGPCTGGVQVWQGQCLYANNNLEWS